MLFNSDKIATAKRNGLLHTQRMTEAYKILHAKKVNEAEQLVSGTKSGESTMLISEGKVNSYDIVFSILDRVPSAKVIITTWGLGEFPLRQLAARKEKSEISELYFLFSDKLKSMKPNEFQLATSIATGFRLYPCHAKLVVIYNDTEGWVFNSSMNLNRNNKLESGVITNSHSMATSTSTILMDIINESNRRTAL